jgi:regulator of protease activity HflC (stomatin/prohibitin superfamily)
MPGIISWIMMVGAVVATLYYFFHCMARPLWIVVRMGESVVVERLGTFHKLLKPGLNFLVPFVEVPRQVRWSYSVEVKNLVNGEAMWRDEVFEDYRISTRETVYDMPPMRCMTEEDAEVAINLTVAYLITDVKSAVYNVQDLYLSIENDLETELRRVVSSLGCRALKSDAIEKRLQCAIGELKWVEKYGVTLQKCQLQHIGLPAEVQQASLRLIAKDVETRAAMRNTQLENERELARVNDEEKLNLRVREIERQAQEHAEYVKERECLAECKRRELLHKQELAERESHFQAVKNSTLSETFHIAYLQGQNWLSMMESGTCQKMVVPANFTSFLGGGGLLEGGKNQ